MGLQDGRPRLPEQFRPAWLLVLRWCRQPRRRSILRQYIMAFHIGNKQKKRVPLWQFITIIPSHNGYLTVHSRFLD